MTSRPSSSRIRVILVDDEAPARIEHARLLAELPQVELVGEASDVATALDLTRSCQPDLVLLDIQLAGESGFDYVDQVAHPAPHIVFVTAYDKHAVQAFECNALDYLLKPVRPERLAEVFRRFHERIRIPRETDTSDLVFIKTSPVPRFVHWNTVQRIVSSGNYTRVHLDDGSICSMLRPLKEWLAGAPAGMFLQVHRQVAIRKDAIREIRSLGSKKHEILLTQGATLPVGRGYYPSVLAALTAL